MKDTITHDQGEYSAIIAQILGRYEKGESIFYYAWSPYWTSARLVPGKDVVWLQVTHTDHPTKDDTSLPNGDNYGFNVNNQHIVANKSVVKNHPDIAKLFSVMRLSVGDVSAQNLLMKKGENKQSDFLRHAKQWIKANQSTFDSWIKEAKAARKKL